MGRRQASRRLVGITIDPGASSPMPSTPQKIRPIRIGRFTIPLPRSRILRVMIGVLLILGGIFSFLPVLGIWMLPLGLVVLSTDIPRVRRWRRRMEVWFHRRYPKLAAKLSPAPRRPADKPGLPPA